MTLVKSVSNSRYAICDTGQGFSVEDKETGERVGWSKSWRKANAIADKLRQGDSNDDG